MKLLAAFTAFCLLMVGLVVWRIAAARETQASDTPALRTVVEQPGANSIPNLADEARPSHGVSASAGARAKSTSTAPTSQADSLSDDKSVSPPGAEQCTRGPQTPPDTPTPDYRAEASIVWADQATTRGALARLSAARAALAEDPDHPTALRDELEALRALDRWDEAADTLERLVRLEPERAEGWLELGETLLRLGRWASAMKPLREYTERRPEDARGWRYLAAAQQALGHLADAEQSWNRVLALVPEDQEALARRGEVRLALRDWVGAAADLERVRQAQPGAIQPVLDLAWARSRLGELDTALELLEGVLAQQPRHVPALNMLSAVAWEAARRDRSRFAELLPIVLDACRRSLAIDPEQPEIRARLAAAEADGKP